MGRKTPTEDLLRELEAGGILTGSAPAPPATKRKSAPARAARRLGTSGLVFAIVAAIIVAVVGSLPFGSLALYPFALFVTLIHETSHAVAAVATGGSVVSLQISPDLSGVVHPSGGIQAVIAPAGYLGATLAGVGLLLTPLRYARWALGALAAVPLLALLLFHPATFFTALWCVAFLAALGLSAWKLPPNLAAFLQIFLGVEAGLNAFRDLMTLLFIEGSSAHIQTDAENMSKALFLPPMFWAVLWTVMSLVLLVAAVYGLIRRDLLRRSVV
jgi:hypothetical protein